MRYTYSLVRFVPDPARGEFVNVGAIVGSEDTGEWDVRQVDNLKRARQLDDRLALPAVTSFIENIGQAFDEYLAAADNEATFEPDARWLGELYERHRNVVQTTLPASISADTLEEAIGLVFDELIVEPGPARMHFVPRTKAQSAMRRAYLQTHSIERERDLFEHVWLETSGFRERIDFVVANGRALQLTHAWSFRIPDQDAVSQRIKAWAWTLQKLRSEGGRIAVPTRGAMEVTSDVDLEVVYVAPTAAIGEGAYRDALAVFSELNVSPHTVDDASSVAAQAVELLAASHAA